MIPWLERLLSEGKNQHWYDSKRMLTAIMFVILGIVGYIDPAVLGSIDLNQYKEGLTAAGLINFLLNFKALNATLPKQ